ncbi:actin-like ATPase domain-containing protein [Auriscalpium vulgare]|uniref:Actin-like ATPase domain-containing protein n=1 Tax=Auriscalpium vulgare TaxID=40419 RepID=A0ACB8RPN0_9AGAM|nr:actin-like ATPase domain-containing protein [Auriscalpium vulgare]
MSASETGPLFLGLDLSTQQLKAIIIAEDSQVVHDVAVGFDRDLPQYGTTNGAIRGPGEGEVASPVAMFVEAMDLLMQRMKDAGVDFGRISAVSGAGQQHGSVYWSADAESALASLDAGKPLLVQLSPGAFSLPMAPIWQDSSTTRECQELNESVGGAQALADLTGSRAYERFTGPQIKRIRRQHAAAYDATSRVSLISSFIPSLFLGSIAPIEISDASGMNLMNVLTCKWDDRLLEACGGPELRAKLGPEPVPGGSTLGKVAKWWVERWGFNPDCLVAPFTGDNPATMVALSTPGDAVLSLGTSTTFLLAVPPADVPPARFTSSHLLTHPTTPDASIVMLCYKNGALAREHVRDRYADKDWAKFNELVEQTPPGNNGRWGLYFTRTEIIPPHVKGEFHFTVEDGIAQPLAADAFPESAHPRAILEAQFLSIRSRLAAILPAHAPPLHRLVLTGGSSANPVIRQLAADLFGMPAYVAEETKEAAGTGGALLAKFAWWRTRAGGGTFEEMRAADVERMKLVASPNKEVTEVYHGLVEPYRVCEEEVVKICAAKARG